MAVGVSLRAATESDRAQADRLLEACGLLRLDAGAQFGSQYVVACDPRGQLAGLAGLERYGSDGLLRSVAVAPEWRGTGLGTELVRNRLGWCRGEGGMEAVYLLTTSAAPFFARLGFREVGREAGPRGVADSHQWASACPASSTAMRLTLR